MSRLFDDRRHGKFYLDPNQLDTETGLAIMKNFLVIRAEFMFNTGCLEYWAISPLFDEIPKGMIPPEYKILVEGDKVTAQKWDDKSMYPITRIDDETSTCHVVEQ